MPLPYSCPRCAVHLETRRNDLGMYWECGNCNGRLATVTVLRKALHADTIQELWQQAMQLQLPALLPCPACDGRMEEVPVCTPVGDTLLDVCTTCHVVWMDAGEIDNLPKVEPVKIEASDITLADLPEEAKLAIARQIAEANSHQSKMDKLADSIYESRKRRHSFWDLLGF